MPTRLTLCFCLLPLAAAAQVVVDYSSILGPARVTDVEVASDGSIWVCGGRASAQLGDGGAFVVKLNPDGTEILAVKTFSSPGGETFPWRMTATPDGGAVVVGHTESPAFEIFGPLGGVHSGRADAFIAKLSPGDLSIEWSTVLGGAQPDVALDVALDQAGRVLVVGYTSSPAFTADRRFGGGNGPRFGAEDWFLARYSAAGDKLLETVLFGGSGEDLVSALTVDEAGRILIAGATDSEDFPSMEGGMQPGELDADAALIRYDPAQQAVDFSARLGGYRGSDRASAVWLNPLGEAVMAGFAASESFPFRPDSGDVGYVFTAVYDLTIPEPKAIYRFGGRPRFNNGNRDNFEIPRDAAPTPDGGAWITGVTAHEEFEASESGLVACPFPVRNRFLTGFAAKIGPDGQPKRVFQAGGNGSDVFYGVALGPDGRVHLAGYTESQWFVTGPRGFSNQRNGEDGFVFAFDPSPARSDRFLASVVGGAGFAAGPIAPGQIVSLFGARIGPACPSAFALDEIGMVPDALGEARVTFNGRPAPVLFAHERQLNVVVPEDLGDARGALVQVDYAGMKSNVLTVPVAPASPALFTLDADGRAAALNQDGSLNSPEAPVEAGAIVVLFGTGLGAMDPPQRAGAFTPLAGPYPRPVGPVRVEIGGIPAEVLYAGAAPGLVAGVFQVNVRVPEGTAAGAKVPVRVLIGETVGPEAFVAIR